MRSDDPLHHEPERGDESSPGMEDLLWDYVDRLNRGEHLDENQLRAEHPTFAGELAEQLKAFQGIGDDVDREEVLGTLGDYTLRRQIARGGMGVVYEAWEHSMERAVALKVLPGAVAADEQALQRFVREAKVAGDLHHPNVVPVYGMGLKEKTPYYAMQYVEGQTLAQVLARVREADDETETPFGPKYRQDFFTALGVAFAEVADGLQHAHSRGVTHRDIKPSNLILDPEADREGGAKSRLRILDFGLARLEGQESLTISGSLVGTPLYMSPEQARRKKIPVDHRTDVYSLGATLYEALCGGPPFRGRDHADTLSQIIERDPVEPRKRNPRVPKDLETIVLKCLRKDADDRYGTAEALGQDLRRFVRGDPIEARPQFFLERLARRLRRNRATLLTLGSVALAFLIALGVAAGSIGWMLRERAELRGNIAREVRSASGESLRLEAEAWSETSPPTRREAKLAQALSLLESAEAMLRSAEEPADSDLRAELRELRAALEADEKAHRLVATLEEILRKRNGRFDFQSGACFYGDAIDEYRRAFARYGIERGSQTPEEAAARITGRREPVREAMVAALDDWSRLAHPADDAERTWLESVLAAADPDAWRREVRENREDRQALEALASRGEAMDQPPATLEFLGNALLALDADAAAVDLCRRALVRHPGDFRINSLLARALRREKSPEAISYYRVAVALRPDAVSYRNLGRALREQGDLSGAVAALERAVRLDPELPDAHLGLGVALRAQENLAGAVASYEQARELDPDCPLVHYNLGNALRDQGRLEEAEASYRRAIELKADYLDAHVNLGSLLLARRRPDEAAAAFGDAIEIDDASADAHYNLGVANLRQGELAAAAESFQRAIDLQGDHASAHLNLGAVLYRQRKLEKAIASFERAIASDRENVMAYVNLGAALCEQGDLDKGVDAYRKALELAPRFAGLHRNLARALEAQRNLEGAIEHWREASDIEPDHAPTHRSLGLALLRSGDHAAAVRAWERVVELVPGDASLRNDLAWRLARLPKAGERSVKWAAKLAEEAVRLKPEIGDYWKTLGVARYRAGDPEGATAALERSMDLRNGGDGGDRLFLAMARWQLGKRDEARREYRKAVEWMEKNTGENEKVRRFRAEAEELMGIGGGREGAPEQVEGASPPGAAAGR